MVKFLIIDGFLHHKNKLGLKKMLEYLNYEYYFGREDDINDYEIIYSPAKILDIGKYSNKFFIFGPHVSVFPETNLYKLKDYPNCVYIQPSEWALKVWNDRDASRFVKMRILPFCVDYIKFFNNRLQHEKNKVLVYTKRRKPSELDYVMNFLNYKREDVILFDYVRGYKEDDYLNELKQCKYGIIVDAHESQGFAIQEALSCDVPLLVWDSRFMNQEYGSKYGKVNCTTIPYWSEDCGEYFHVYLDLEKTYNIFIKKLKENKYRPRDFILKTLNEERCGDKLKSIVDEFYND